MKVRQDAWSHEDDLLLAETVLRHIREGSTQLNAFDEVGDALNRTSAACGFRWNAVVRDKYEDAIKLAKKHRKQRKRQIAQQSKPSYRPAQQPKEMPVFKTEPSAEVFDKVPEPEYPVSASNNMTMDDVISFLSAYSENSPSVKLLQQENEELNTRLKEMEEAFSQLKRDYQTIEEDYQSIIQIMDRARKMAVLDEESSDRPAAAFRMDKNGNLEKVAK